MPLWVALHQFGAGDGPRMVHAAMSESDHMPAADVMLKLPKRNNQAVLVHNNIPAFSSVGDIMKQIAGRMTPWYESSLKLRSPQGVGGDDSGTPRPPADIPNTGTGGNTGSNAPFPQTTTQPRSSDTGVMRGVNPRLVAAVRGGAELALPPGYTLREVSGVRGNPRSFHSRGRASDWQIYKPNGEPIPHKGEDTTGLYTRLARGVKTWVAANDPQLMPHIGYGGAFGTKLGGGGVPDLMHYDLGGSRGRMRPEMQFANLKPLAANERNVPVAGQQATRVAATTPPAAAPKARVDKPSEFYVPPELRPAKTAKTTVDPSTQFGVPNNQGVIAASLPFGDFAPAGVASTRRVDPTTPGKLPSVMMPQPLPPRRPPDAPQPIPPPPPPNVAQAIPPEYDPEGKGYDYESAVNAGISPDATGHWPSREPTSGSILKGRGHATFDKTQQAETEAGMDINKRQNDRYYSTPIPTPPVLALLIHLYLMLNRRRSCKVNRSLATASIRRVYDSR
jgi:hypothetical protein